MSESIFEAASDCASNVSNSSTFTHNARGRVSSATFTPMVWLGLDCFHYVGGERVTGEIMINLPADTAPGQLLLKSRGYEEVKVYTGDKGMKSCKQARNTIYEYQNLIHAWDETILSGQYVFPYTFKLPHFVPSSFNFKGEDSNNNLLKAKIVYEASIEFLVPSDCNKNMKDTKRILVRSQLNNGLVNVSAENNEVIVGCMGRKGVTTLRLIVLNEDHGVIDGTLRYRLEPNNSKCSGRINQVTSYVSFIMEINIEGKSYRYARVLSHSTKDVAIEPYTPTILDQQYEYTADIRLPGSEQNSSTVETPLIHSRYSIEAIVYYQLSCKEITATVSLPVYINPRNYKDKVKPKLPSKWDPKEHPIVNMTIGGNNIKPCHIDEHSTVLQSTGMWSTSSPSLANWNSDSMAEIPITK